MSGIGGLWHLDGRAVPRETLEAMAHTLKHRGLDGSGISLNEAVGLFAQMLYVTPESVGEKQPLRDSNSGSVLVFDGRLDNREELYPLLDIRDHSISDTEMILKAYAKWREGFAARLKGDFAIAIFDPRSRELLLARDAIGVRPLYYAHQNNVLAFGSEIKTLMACPHIETAPNHAILSEWVLNFCYDREETFFQDIHALKPGHLLKVTPDSVKTVEFWDFDPSLQTELKTFEDIRDAYREKLETSVRRRMRSAYPVALSLSGGMDSTSIYGLADRIWDKENLCPRFECFSWQQRDGLAHDEYDYVDAVSAFGKAPVTPVPMVQVGPYQNMEQSVWMSENPLLDTHWGNFHNIMKAASDSGARTFLTGLWSDQFFDRQGYIVDLFRRGRWLSIYRDYKTYLQWNLDVSLRWRIQAFLTQLMRFHIPHDVKPMLRPFWKTKKYEDWYSETYKALARKRWRERERPFKKAATCHARDMYEAARAAYMPMILERENKFKAYYGMDCASPYLDADLIQFIMSIPGDLMIYKGMSKGILRESMRGIIPEKVRTRRNKSHFSLVGNASMHRDYFAIMDRLLKGRQIEKFGIVDLEKFAYAKGLLREGLESESSLTAWSLTHAMGLEALLEVFFTDTFSRKIESTAIQGSVK